MLVSAVAVQVVQEVVGVRGLLLTENSLSLELQAPTVVTAVVIGRTDQYY